MFGLQRSYTDEDVYLVAMRWRKIEEEAEEASPTIREGTLNWAKEAPDNKAKIHKALGIQHGFILASFKGDAKDFDSFLRDVLNRTHNLGFCMRFGKLIFRTHMRLRRKMDFDYFRGVEEGRKQAHTGENFYLRNRRAW